MLPCFLLLFPLQERKQKKLGEGRDVIFLLLGVHKGLRVRSVTHSRLGGPLREEEAPKCYPPPFINKKVGGMIKSRWRAPESAPRSLIPISKRKGWDKGDGGSEGWAGKRPHPPTEEGEGSPRHQPCPPCPHLPPRPPPLIPPSLASGARGSCGGGGRSLLPSPTRSPPPLRSHLPPAPGPLPARRSG